MKTYVVCLAILGMVLGSPGISSAAEHGDARDDGHGSRQGRQERFLYVATIAQSASDPDFITVVGADPRRHGFGQIVSRIDMPNVGDELHHFGYSFDQKRLIVPGLFSNRIHVFRINGDGRGMKLGAVNEELVARSGYIIPHRWSPRFVKHSIDDGEKEKIAAIDPDFQSRPQPLVPDGIRWSMPDHSGALEARWEAQVESTTV